jgi:hypothetical protein
MVLGHADTAVYHFFKKGIIMVRHALSALLFTGAISVALTVPAAAPANAADDDNLIIQNTGNLKCLQPAGGSVDNGAPIVQEPCDPTNDAQKWVRQFNGDFTNRLVNKHSLKCLDARGGATNGTPVQQWTCNSISNEKWAAANFLPAVTQVVSRVSNTTSHCLDNPSQGTADGAPMQIFACNTTPAQVWFVGS